MKKLEKPLKKLGTLFGKSLTLNNAIRMINIYLCILCISNK